MLDVFLWTSALLHVDNNIILSEIKHFDYRYIVLFLDYLELSWL